MDQQKETTLISIVSDQPMPNVMAILQDDRHFTHVDFIVSSDPNDPGAYDSRFDNIYLRTKSFLDAQGRTVTRQPPTRPYDVSDVMATCQKAVDEHRACGRSVVFNITGGTKVMALGAFLCALHNGLDTVYVESRDRRLISLPAPADAGHAIPISGVRSRSHPFDEERFRCLDVAAYVALYGLRVDRSRSAESLDPRHVAQANVLAEEWTHVRPLLVRLQQEIGRARKSGPVSWPWEMTLRQLTPKQRNALQRLQSVGALGWMAEERIITCSADQESFLRGRWVEVYTLHALAQSGLFHDVRGDVTLQGVAGQWDVMLTVNATLAIIECKSEAKLSEQLGKLRAIQTQLGGLYARSFVVRSGLPDHEVTQQAKLFGITSVINGNDLLNLVPIVAKAMVVRAAAPNTIPKI